MASLMKRIKGLFKRKANTQQSQAKAAPAQGSAQQQPIQSNQKVAQSASSSGQLTVQLQNQTSSSTVYAYITGTALDNGNKLFLLSSDAKTPFYPPNPSSTGQKLTQDVSIRLGAPGSSINATIPRLAGGRIWFSIGTPLVFYVNPGPGLVEPSIFNPQDPNINTNFGFCEFTFNNAQVFANISYVDFVGPPVALNLTDTSNNVQHISGLPANGLTTICNALIAQTAKDGRRWSSLIVKDQSGNNLRVLSPNSGILLNPSWFQTYWTDYVNKVYALYAQSGGGGKTLTVNTQSGYNNVNAQVGSKGNLNFGPGGLFQKPTAADIFSCNSGPFATGGNAETNTLIPRVSAAFNRSTLLLPGGNVTPNGTSVSQYYTAEPSGTTNHYARIVHAANLDGLGYTFPYDDVTPDGGQGQEGAVFSFAPMLLTVTVGGNNAYKV